MVPTWNQKGEFVPFYDNDPENMDIKIIYKDLNKFTRTNTNSTYIKTPYSSLRD